MFNLIHELSNFIYLTETWAATSGVTDCQQAFIGGIAYGGYARKVCSWHYIYSVFCWNDTKVFSKYLIE